MTARYLETSLSKSWMSDRNNEYSLYLGAKVRWFIRNTVINLGGLAI